MSFLNYFNSTLYEVLNPVTDKWKKLGVDKNLYQRGDGFKIIFEKLSSLEKNNYKILETGCAREIRNIRDQSTQMFEDFLNYYDGKLFSVDISDDNCKLARKLVGDKVKIECSDSVKFLKNNDWNDFDLFYLDSYDVKWRNPRPSAEHHFKEFKEIEKYIKKDTILAIDDNTFLSDSGNRTGKGMLIYDYLLNNGVRPTYDGYTLVYIFEKPLFL